MTETKTDKSRFKVGDVVRVVKGPYTGTVLPIRSFFINHKGLIDLAEKSNLSFFVFPHMVELITDPNVEFAYKIVRRVSRMDGGFYAFKEFDDGEEEDHETQRLLEEAEAN